MNQTLLKEQNEAIEKSRQVFKNYYKSKIDNLLKNYCKKFPQPTIKFQFVTMVNNDKFFTRYENIVMGYINNYYESSDFFLDRYHFATNKNGYKYNDCSLDYDCDRLGLCEIDGVVDMNDIDYTKMLYIWNIQRRSAIPFYDLYYIYKVNDIFQYNVNENCVEIGISIEAFFGLADYIKENKDILIKKDVNEYILKNDVKKHVVNDDVVYNNLKKLSKHFQYDIDNLNKRCMNNHSWHVYPVYSFVVFVVDSVKDGNINISINRNLKGCGGTYIIDECDDIDKNVIMKMNKIPCITHDMTDFFNNDYKGLDFFYNDFDRIEFFNKNYNKAVKYLKELNNRYKLEFDDYLDDLSITISYYKDKTYNCPAVEGNRLF